ncbi:AMP deaminase [Edhazardia aedis USNM 41457]|uniref:AMP deaminase n=1 Tax=Edhazardia aedis (strain USNM 41457) TaxID=1003232 RepID=J9DBG2_EDHAE|nr:AMP deaminase [Edhazardia aedis USNM 41457]|eukprot:EJW04834.1 AMP deaminase [Edhazardia aedis USNM 41457]
MDGVTFSWNDFELTEKNKFIYERLAQCVEKRSKYLVFSLQNKLVKSVINKDEHIELMQDFQSATYTNYMFDQSGIYTLCRNGEYNLAVPSLKEFYMDSEFIISVANHRPTKSLCFRRLENLRHNFLMYKNLSADREKNEQKNESKKDFYKVVKVDTHVHHSACMNSKHLLKFIKHKVQNNAKDKVLTREDGVMTLGEVFNRLNIPIDNFCIDSLDTHALTDTFQRFDRFNAKYNPYGQPILRDIFLKHDNYIKGRYLSELTKQVFNLFDDSKYSYAEYRISIYGKSKSEWANLSKWVIKNNLISQHVKWLIQIPRIFYVMIENGQINSFGEMLENIFEPLFAVTMDPNSNPELAKFLTELVGFDTVDDESLKERRYHKKFPVPNDWRLKENPPYSYYIYYIYSNIAVLNQLRLSKGLQPFSFRPHCGETGDWEHLAFAFLTAKSINHGVQLRKCLPLQYLYYICKIGLAMSPLSNNSLFISVEKNPFPDFFAKGLNVSLSTDDPLQFHFTKEPLMEEYSIATQIWKLSSADQCEIARNSVLQSDFPNELKRTWLGLNLNDDINKNNVQYTNVPNMRIYFRNLLWLGEYKLVFTFGASQLPENCLNSSDLKKYDQ